ncbi:glycosyltransferase family 25 protein [Hortaea werneckii]|nr:glycosyltransferase family 25 protein [Hortaea werneckii]KAI6987718.1 glycosyltransferase family 25 protein [Hortaea werneckii]KAI7141265.1 glycosyltransferase family 25 protein [Hortaea werneckii]KAI7168680.1 glycosyltransferase family 25 protein [Hortaea werneckii]
MERRRQRLLLAVIFLGICFLLYRSSDGYETLRQRTRGGSVSNAAHDVDLRGLEPANATLGFGAVVAVSRAGSPRRESLLLASNITEIDITIPTQPKWTDKDVKNLRAEKDSTITKGSALAWLGHLNALRWFLSTDLETVMIMEDDVDWDIHLRTFQIPAAAAAVRQLVSEQSQPAGATKYKPQQNNYWGNSSTWDILYLGHCGDIFKPSSWNSRVPRAMYTDPFLPPRTEMHPYTSKFLESIDIPEDRRLIHQSIFPLCTFGFALTREAAWRLLHEVASREADGGTMAYDVRVLEACRDLGFRCWSANPELFHHMDAESEIAVANQDAPDGEGAESEKAGADQSGRLKSLRVGSAPNIACGARSSNFFTQDPGTLEFLKQKVGREGKCLRDPMEEEMRKRPV